MEVKLSLNLLMNGFNLQSFHHLMLQSLSQSSYDLFLKYLLNWQPDLFFCSLFLFKLFFPFNYPLAYLKWNIVHSRWGLSFFLFSLEVRHLNLLFRAALILSYFFNVFCFSSEVDFFRITSDGALVTLNYFTKLSSQHFMN